MEDWQWCFKGHPTEPTISRPRISNTHPISNVYTHSYTLWTSLYTIRSTQSPNTHTQSLNIHTPANSTTPTHLTLYIYPKYTHEILDKHTRTTVFEWRRNEWGSKIEREKRGFTVVFPPNPPDSPTPTHNCSWHTHLLLRTDRKSVV